MSAQDGQPGDGAGERLFVAAREAVSRTADCTGKAPLLDATLRQFALGVLERARGHTVTGDAPMPMTLWLDGATDTWDGRAFQSRIRDFVDLLDSRAEVVAAKRTGWVIEPTTTLTGRRTNADTVAMHALFLDADDVGAWDALLEALQRVGLAYIAYQSGGWTAATPKWRVVLPLSTSFAVDTDARRRAWKTVYNHARVVFGAVAQLHNHGFDPTTETPSIPWFLTERRAATDPLRQTVWRPGAALDLMGLALALPAIDEDDSVAAPAAPSAAAQPLDDARLEEIVAALCVPMAAIRHTRRELYLALAGAICDRGAADDAVDVIEEISRRCPGDDRSKHAEHVHCARTTVEQWRQSGVYTRIGTLNEIAPEVAKALDAALPDQEREGFLALAYRLAHRTAAGPPPTEGDAPDWQPTVVVDHKELRKFAVSLRRRKRKGESQKDAIHWILLDRMLGKRPLADPVETDSVTGLTRDDSICKLMSLLAFKFPRNTPAEAVVEIVRPSVFEMLGQGERPERWLKMAERSYVMSLADRLGIDSKRAAELAESQSFAHRMREAESRGLRGEAALRAAGAGGKR